MLRVYPGTLLLIPPTTIRQHVEFSGKRKEPTLESAPYYTCSSAVTQETNEHVSTRTLQKPRAALATLASSPAGSAESGIDRAAV